MTGGTPKLGVVSVGHSGVHRGAGHSGAVIDDYPIRFGVRNVGTPESSRTPPSYSKREAALPATSQRQQRFFGAIKGGAIPKPKGMSDSVVDEFASTKRKGLPEHAADGWMGRARKLADGKKAEHWMEDAFAHAGKDGAHSLHNSLHVSRDQSIPAYRVRDAARSGDAHTRAQAQAAINANPGRYGR